MSDTGRDQAAERGEGNWSQRDERFEKVEAPQATDPATKHDYSNPEAFVDRREGHWGTISGEEPPGGGPAVAAPDPETPGAEVSHREETEDAGTD